METTLILMITVLLTEWILVAVLAIILRCIGGRKGGRGLRAHFKSPP